jgi:hypothetical protein
MRLEDESSTNSSTKFCRLSAKAIMQNKGTGTGNKQGNTHRSHED